MKKLTLLLMGLALAGAGLVTAQVLPDGLEGKWIADNGNGPAQVFIFEIRGNNISGVICGPCDPAHMFVLEDGSLAGDRITFYIRHDDRGEGLGKYGPYRDVFTGTIAGNEMHVRWHREGGGENEDPHGEMTLIGPLRLPIPRAPLPRPMPMSGDAAPVLQAVTIAPSRPGERTTLLINRNGLLTATNNSLRDLIRLAYDLDPRQIDGPAWLETDRYDVTGKPNLDGVPNIKQLRAMMQKLLADRFQLTFHRDKKDLTAYTITVANSGAKLIRNETNPNGLPGFGRTGLGGLEVRNATMAEFANQLQAFLPGQLVVDQTGLGSARYDFVLNWTPDASQPHPGGPGLVVVPPSPGDPPGLVDAVQQQLGLKLESTRGPVDVLVIDRAEKPSGN